MYSRFHLHIKRHRIPTVVDVNGVLLDIGQREKKLPLTRFVRRRGHLERLVVVLNKHGQFAERREKVCLVAGVMRRGKLHVQARPQHPQKIPDPVHCLHVRFQHHFPLENIRWAIPRERIETLPGVLDLPPANLDQHAQGADHKATVEPTEDNPRPRLVHDFYREALDPHDQPSSRSSSSAGAASAFSITGRTTYSYLLGSRGETFAPISTENLRVAAASSCNADSSD